MVQERTRPPTRKPPPTKHPEDDAMPPYTPGGVPAPEESRTTKHDRPSSYYPPKRDP